MNIIQKSLASLALIATALFCGSCSDDRWDDQDVTGTRSQTLWEVISTRSELSEFKTILQESGYDALLQSSGTYTVLAPVNEAVKALDADEEPESVSASHIALFEYNKAALDTMKYLTMYSGKKVVLDSMRLETQEVVCRNGILRFAHYATGNQPNIYEVLESLADQYKMAKFILSLGDSVMDMSKSVQIGLDPTTNQPIYDTVMMFTNPLFDRVPLNDNDSLVSLVLLDDESFDALSAKYWPYLKQHNGQHRESTYATTFKIDSAKTTEMANREVVYDMTCQMEHAAAQDYVSTAGVRLNMTNATVSRTISTANGSIQIASGVTVRLRDNKIKDVYVQAQDYYATNESYVFTRVTPTAMGGYDVVLCGVDTMRTYKAYYVAADTLADGSVAYHKTDSIITVSSSTNYGYYGTSFSSNGYPQLNYAKGGSYLAYKAPLFSCRYNIFWRSVDDRSVHCRPDTACVDYDKYLENPNYPCGGVLRNVQKLYLSQPGDEELVYNSDQSAGDFVLNYSPCNLYNSTYKNYRCMAGYDPDATDDEVGKKGGFARLGINAGVGVDNSLYETPLVWCQTATPDQSTVYYSGIVGVSTNTNYKVNEKTGKPTAVPKDQFCCYYQGDATVFVTNSAFNQTNTTTPTASKVQPHGSIYLDYIHFVPVIEGEDE
jgi:uncharacterized surface protein with fasciclin (FAS1) repeats